MLPGYEGAEVWAAAFERFAREILGVRVALAGGELYRVVATACGEHGPRCVCVTYGMFREHLRWRHQTARAAAERAVRTMLPPEGAEAVAPGQAEGAAG
jgi:hypothetical protein